MTNDLDPHILCTENISLLYLLHSVPSAPKTTSIYSDQIRETGYNLPFEKERGLASTLAFLSSIQDDPNRIPALCIESTPDNQALKVHIAVNKSSYNDSNVHLMEMTHALNKILASLSRLIDTDGNGGTVENVFDTIITLAVVSLRNIRGKISSRSELVDSVASFEIRANEAIKLIVAWTKHQTLVRLRELVEGIHKLWRVSWLSDLLNRIPNSLMNPDLRTSLYNIICKVARYKEAARRLYRMAKRFPVLRRVEVVPVTLEPQMYSQVKVDQYSPSLSATLHRIVSKHSLSVNPDRIYTLLRLGKEKAERMFSEHVRRALQGAKIHSEIQLFYHIEGLCLTRPPRVVCSSKDACYLCDLFITAITKFHSPKCHGRLYPGWRLPTVSEQDQTLRNFNHALEEQVRNSIRELLRKKIKFKLPDPRESTILTMSQSVSTLVPSLTSPNIMDAVNGTTTIPRERMVNENVKQSTATLPNVYSQDDENFPECSASGGVKTGITEIKTPTTTGDQSQALSSSSKESDTHHKQGVQCGNTISGCIPSDDVSCILIGPLKLYIEYSASHTGSQDLHKDLKLDIEWITETHDRPAPQNAEVPVIDIEELAYTASLSLNSLNELDLNYRGHIFKIRLHPQVNEKSFNRIRG
ncbi:hypothetical protein FOXB_17053 [Fusarium oxysporum f. sp. conglutinans Fo5176]|uniref:Uncharacterized protein n=1 Tax=Fusarium oxysporum (strain Fo5176) TaxID=660025 RepID=F9GEG9_FUSOF|nr:hypothetical protein FOXB_17053 [Fusarium oxysporum f. sp. conglutinans Fo5176]